MLNFNKEISISNVEETCKDDSTSYKDDASCNNDSTSCKDVSCKVDDKLRLKRQPGTDSGEKTMKEKDNNETSEATTDLDSTLEEQSSSVDGKTDEQHDNVRKDEGEVAPSATIFSLARKPSPEECDQYERNTSITKQKNKKVKRKQLRLDTVIKQKNKQKTKRMAPAQRQRKTKFKRHM